MSTSPAPRPRPRVRRTPRGRSRLAGLCVLVAVLCALAAAAKWEAAGSGRFVAVAGILGSLGGLRIARRDHLGGGRSRSQVLGAAAAAASVVPLYLADVAPPVVLPAMGATFLIAWLAFESV